MPDENWRHIVDDFAATFSITRHSLLESLTFYLLDDQADEALQVILIDQNIHPKLNADFAFHQGRRHINLISFFFFFRGRACVCCSRLNLKKYLLSCFGMIMRIINYTLNIFVCFGNCFIC